jgi:DNA polymerase III sliding clamp (beta) subunit (PCNA family)
MPRNMPYLLKVSRTAVLEGMTRIGIAAAEDDSIKISFSPSAMTMSSRDYARNRAVDETVPCEHDVQFEAIGCNRRFISDAMRTLCDENVCVELQAKDRPMIFRGENTPNIAILVMPIQFASPAAPAQEGEAQAQAEGE